MSDVVNNDTNMDHVDKRVLQLAALVDATIRFHCANLQETAFADSDGTGHVFDEMDDNYIVTWLRKEKDPLLVTILATLTGDRDPTTEEA